MFSLCERSTINFATWVLQFINRDSTNNYANFFPHAMYSFDRSRSKHHLFCLFRLGTSWTFQNILWVDKWIKKRIIFYAEIGNSTKRLPKVAESVVEHFFLLTYFHVSIYKHIFLTEIFKKSLYEHKKYLIKSIKCISHT